jgi:hypothetical protein
MNREIFTQIVKEVLGQYTSQTKLDELFDRLRDGGRGPPGIEWRRISQSSDIYFHAMSGDLAIGFVKKDVFAMSREPYWQWSMIVDAPRTDFKPHGQVDDIETAKAAVLKNWQLWLDLAAVRPRQGRQK